MNISRLRLKQITFILITAILLFNCDDPSNPPPPGTPVILVFQGTSPLAHNGIFDFGTETVGTEGKIVEFTISNTGTAILELNGMDGITVSGPDEAMFTLEIIPEIHVQPETSISFSIKFNPSSAGNKEAAITIKSNDPEAGELLFSLKGTGYTPAPGMSVSMDANPISNGTVLYNLGTIEVGTPQSFEFMISNSGDSLLSLTGTPRISVTGDGFTLESDAESSVPSEDSTTFTINCAPLSAGTQTALVSIGNNSSSDNPYEFTVTYEAVQYFPEISITHIMTYLESGISSVEFIDTKCGLYKDIEFFIRNGNTGDLVLTGTPLVSVTPLSGTEADTFTVTQPSKSVITNGSYTILKVRFSPQSRGTKSATISIPNNDADESPFIFEITGTGLGPAINIKNGSIDVENGSTVTFPIRYIAQEYTINFTLENNGDLNQYLYLTGTPLVNLTGTDADSFSVQQMPGSTIGPYNSHPFRICFQPNDAGIKTATVIIESNDMSINPYSFTVKGTSQHWKGSYVFPAIASSAKLHTDGNNITVLYTKKSNSAKYLAKSFDGGRSWNETDTHYLGMPSYICDAFAINDNSVFIAKFASGNLQNKPLYLDSSYDGGLTWNSDNLITVDSFGILKSGTQYDINAGIHFLAYTNEISSSNVLRFASSADNGVSWPVTDIFDIDTIGSYGGYQDMVISGNAVYLSYYDYKVNLNEVKFAKSTDGGSTWLPGNIKTVDIVGSYSDSYTSDTAIAVNGTDIYIFYYYAKQKALKVAISRDGGATWLPENMFIIEDKVIEQGRVVSAGIANGRVFVAYRDGLNSGRLKFAYSLNDGASWSLKTVGAETDVVSMEIKTSGNYVYLICVTATGKMILYKDIAEYFYW